MGSTSILAVSPHLDDAVLSAGAAISATVHDDAEVTVCTVFAGRPTPPYSPVAKNFHDDCGCGPDLMSLRRDEDLAALRSLGAAAIHLDFLDAIYRMAGGKPLCRAERDMFSPRLPSQPELTAAITRQLAAVIRRCQPTQVWTCAAIGGHVDHRHTRTAVLTACLGWPAPVYLWEDVPYAYERKSLSGGTPAVGPVPSGPEHLERKLDAIRCYPSQLRMLWPDTNWRELMSRQARDRLHLGACEVLWPSSPSPRDADMRRSL